MIKIRLSRHGTKKGPIYRIVATDERRKMKGMVEEVLGYYDQAKNKVKIDKEKLTSWISKGAQLTSAVKNMISS